jgi:hypothetical protein
MGRNFMIWQMSRANSFHFQITAIMISLMTFPVLAWIG